MAQVRPMRADARRNHERLLTVAEEAFAEHGEGASLDDIAKRAGVGSGTVAVLILTGLVNSWILIGPERIESLWTTPYGGLLAVKLLAFVAMLGLAAANRFRLTPAFGRSLGAVAGSDAERAALRRSIAAETALGLSVLLLVAWFGTLAPPAAG